MSLLTSARRADLCRLVGHTTQSTPQKRPKSGGQTRTWSQLPLGQSRSKKGIYLHVFREHPDEGCRSSKLVAMLGTRLSQTSMSSIPFVVGCEMAAHDLGGTCRLSQARCRCGKGAYGLVES